MVVLYDDTLNTVALGKVLLLEVVFCSTEKGKLFLIDSKSMQHYKTGRVGQTNFE